ncbi:MAG: hypothetical protein IBX62_00570 [Coriobacteriia bacterium]|nr:hypothetical protein [Coriobacteriia bacterium]
MRPRHSHRTSPRPARSRARRLRAAAALVLAAALPSAAAGVGLVSTTIAIDGDMTDWAGVLSSAPNVTSDPIGAADPDNPGSANRDLCLAAYTWDAENLYVYLRRTASGNNSVHYIIYVDVDNSGTMSDVDRVVDLNYNGSAFQPGGSGVFGYAPAAPGGDPLVGDGQAMPGRLGAPVPDPGLNASANGDGIRHEAAIPWAALGLPAGSPVQLKFACSLNTNLPASIQDNTAVASLIRRQVAVSAGTTRGGAAGNDVEFAHTVTNHGNVDDTYDLSAVSARGWPLQLTDEAGSPIASLAIPAGGSAGIRVRVTIPAGTADGTRDTLTVTCTSSSASHVTASATDHAVCGEVIVIPDLTNSVAPGSVSVFRNTLANHGDRTLTLALTAASDRGWTAEVFAADGVTPLSEAVLPPGGSRAVRVRVHVPAGAALGTADVTSLRAVALDDPGVGGTGRDTTLVRPELSVVPDNTGTAGAGTAVTYLHTVTNSSSETRTVTLDATDSSGWPVQVLEADGVTPLASVALPPFGGSSPVRVRVSVPAGAASGAVSTTTLRAGWGALTAVATDVTTVSTLVFFADGSYAEPTEHFVLGDAVHVRASGLAPGSTVRFRWLDTSGAVVHASPDVPVDTGGQAASSYTIPAAGPPGAWTCVLVTNKGAELARRTFYAGYRAHIESVSAPDVPSAASDVSADVVLRNHGAVVIADSTLTYLVWHDVDSDGVCSNGDLYVDEAGEIATYAGTGGERTRLGSGVSVPAGGSWSEPATWTVPAANLPYPGTYHVTAEWRAADGTVIDTRGTTFLASAYRLTLTISESALDAGTVEPGSTHVLAPVNVAVEANTRFDLYKAVGGDAALMGLSSGLLSQVDQSSGLHFYVDSISLDIPWEAEPGPLGAVLTYTVVAQ